jgi:protoporphyrinogen oxidase
MNLTVNGKTSIGIIGAGISGVSFARLVSDKGCQATVYEQNPRPGGLIQCDLVQGSLFHKVGGHVFNSKNEKVLKWFWSHFDKDNEFIPAVRNAVIYLDGEFIGYPIEFNLDQIDSALVTTITTELHELIRIGGTNSGFHANFYEFLLSSFGKTLCDLYFFPYNHKIWKTDLTQVPLDWLEGKLPMTSPGQILLNLEEVKQSDSMVHSTFFYPLSGGSQFIIERLSADLDLVNQCIHSITIDDGRVILNRDKNLAHEILVYTGDIRRLIAMLSDRDLQTLGLDAADMASMKDLPSNSTSTMLCECDVNPYSWIYIPDPEIKIHRIIMTGNFSHANTSPQINKGRTTCTIEHSGYLSFDDMALEAKKLPFTMKPLSYNYCENSYVVHSPRTSSVVNTLRQKLQKGGIYCLGRFSEWQYYNMDAAIESAMKLVDSIVQP